MIIGNINQCVNGWFVGDFEAAVFRTALAECAHHHYPQGYKGPSHTHRVAVEVNYVLSGSCVVNGTHVCKAGDIFVYEPNDVSDVQFLEDTNLIIFKSPSVPGDKYNV